MESVVLLLLVSSVIVGFVLRNRIGRKAARFLTLLSAAGITLGFALFYLLPSIPVSGLHPYRAALIAGALLVLGICLLPIGILGLLASSRPGAGSRKDSG